MIEITLYQYELKKLFHAKINLLALAGSVILLLLLVFSSIYEVAPLSRESAKELDGRLIDAQLLEEMKPYLYYENGQTQLLGTEESEKYRPVLNTVSDTTGRNTDLTQFDGAELYRFREKWLDQRLKLQGVTESEKEFWRHREVQVQKPFVYHYHEGPANLLRSFQALGFFVTFLSAVGLSGVYAKESADNMNQLLLCSRYGKRKLYAVKFAAGLTWILTAALLSFLAILLPSSMVYGMEGMGEMLQLVKPWSMLPLTIGQMLLVYMGIFLLAAVLFAAVTMFLSVTVQNSLAVTGMLMGYLLLDLFVQFPDRYRLLQKIWLLRPNAVLMNTGITNYRLTHFAGRLFLNFQVAAVVYAGIAVTALFVGRWKYQKLQVGG